MAKKKKYYAVASGRNPGIYTEWAGPEGAQVQVVRYKGAVYKGFATKGDAKAFIAEHNEKASETTSKDMKDSKRLNNSNPQTQSACKNSQILIYTDGGCINNPGPGGYGIVITNGNKTKEVSGGYRLTTNNRMELMACIVALRALKKPNNVIVHSDSKYVVDGISKGWAKKWQSKNWIKSDRKPALNPDLWEQLLQLCEKHNVEFKWVKGHAGIELNERCDYLATKAARGKELLIDEPYENQNTFNEFSSNI
jgi:ribonuclease HI